MEVNTHMQKNEATTKTYIQNNRMFPFGSHSIIKNIIGTNKIVLDVGCASGDLGRLCENNTFYGIDGNTDAINKAKLIYKDVKLIDLNLIPANPLFDEKFDYIIFADVLEHLLYPEQLLMHFRNYLKPEGKIIVSLPNVALWRIRLLLLAGKFDYTDYGVLDRTHLHLYTFDTAKKLLTTVGLNVISEQGAAYTFGQLLKVHKLLRNLFSVHIIIEARI